MGNKEIINRCTGKLGMAKEEAAWVAENIYNYAVPDFSEWSWTQIDNCLREVLWFRGKTEDEIVEALA